MMLETCFACCTQTEQAYTMVNYVAIGVLVIASFASEVKNASKYTFAVIVSLTPLSAQRSWNI